MCKHSVKGPQCYVFIQHCLFVKYGFYLRCELQRRWFINECVRSTVRIVRMGASLRTRRKACPNAACPTTNHTQTHKSGTEIRPPPWHIDHKPFEAWHVKFFFIKKKKMTTVPAIWLGQSIIRKLVETATKVNESVCVSFQFLHTISETILHATTWPINPASFPIHHYFITLPLHYVLCYVLDDVVK